MSGTHSGAWTGPWSRAFAPVDGASVTFLRVAFGLLVAWDAYCYLLLGTIRIKYLAPGYLIPWAGFEWIGRWPGDGLYWHFYLLCALGLAIAAGFRARTASALYCLGFGYVVMLSPAFFQNHFYLICLLSGLFALIPASGMLSVDARLHPGLRSETVPAWSVWILRFQVALVYFYGGVAKLDSDWLHGYPMRLWLPPKGTLPILGTLLEQPWMAVFMSWSGLAIDLLATPALLWRRSRPFAFAVLVVFHLWNSQLFSIGVFPWLAIALTTIFFEPGWPRRVFNWPRRRQAGPSPFEWTPRRRALATFLTLYAALQLLIPLRQHLYPGDPNWTDEGHRFAWRMMLRSRLGLITFQLTSPETGDSWVIDPAPEVLPFQYRRLAADPAMIHVYARHLSEEATEEGHARVEVRARVLSSLNGREPEPFIDPSVDLAASEPSILRPSPWILPLTKPLGTGWRDAGLDSNAAGQIEFD